MVVEEDVVHKLRKQVKSVEDEKDQLRTQVELGAQREADVEGTFHIVRTYHCPYKTPTHKHIFSAVQQSCRKGDTRIF